jgi:hypothetical protein
MNFAVQTEFAVGGAIKWKCVRIETCADDAGSGQATRLNRSKRVAENSGSDVGGSSAVSVCSGAVSPYASVQ